MKNLIEKRNNLVKEADAIRAAREAANATVYTNEQMERLNAIKLEVSDLTKTIEAEREIEIQRNFRLDEVTKTSVERKGNEAIVESFRGLANAQSGTKLVVPFSNSFEKRAAITTSSNSHFGYTDMNGLSIAVPDLVLDKVGARTYYFESGSQDFPNITAIVATGPGTEDSSISDATLTSAKITLAPGFYSASLEVTKKFLTTSKPENIASLIADLSAAVKREVQKDTVDSMNALSTVVATGTSITMHSGTTLMEKAIVGSAGAFILGTTAYATAHNRKVGSDQKMVLSNSSQAGVGQILSYPTFRNELQSNATYGYLIDPAALAMAYWGDGISFEVVTDSTLARKGSVLLIATAMAAGSYINSQKVSVSKNFSSWS